MLRVLGDVDLLTQQLLALEVATILAARLAAVHVGLDRAAIEVYGLVRAGRVRSGTGPGLLVIHSSNHVLNFRGLERLLIDVGSVLFIAPDFERVLFAAVVQEARGLMARCGLEINDVDWDGFQCLLRAVVLLLEA